MHVTYYRQNNCPLCDEAEMMMKLVQEDYTFTWSTVDIQSDDEIHEKYMLMVPVLEKDGKVLAYGNIDYATLVFLLENE